MVAEAETETPASPDSPSAESSDQGKAVGAALPAAAATASSTAPIQRSSRLPSASQLPLIVILSLANSALCYSAINQWTRGELGIWAKTLGSWGEVVVLAGWKICELTLAWYGNLDSYDVAALSLLSHGPTLYLLTTFYGISPLTAAACLGVDVSSSFLPFLLLRPLSGAHSAEPTVRNREVIVDRPIQAYTTLLAGAIYSVTLSMAYLTFLPRTLVLYFTGIPSVEPAYSAASFLFVSIPAAVLSLAFGLAARSFIFTPTATTGPAPEDAKLRTFDPVTATLGETALFNLWGFTAQTKVVVVRTLTVMALVGVTTYLQCSMTITGIEPYGAAVYASVWVLAALFTGLGLGVVGRD